MSFESFTWRTVCGNAFVISQYIDVLIVIEGRLPAGSMLKITSIVAANHR